MRQIQHEQVVQAVATLCITACYELSEEMARALTSFRQAERDPNAQERLDQLLDNARLAAEQRIPLCQDTGLTVVFVEHGQQCTYIPPDDDPTATLDTAINEGVQLGYDQGLLRKSVVAEPLGDRANTQTNCPAVIHHTWTAGTEIRITVMAKGGGCENRSAFIMLKPTAPAEAVCDFIVHTAERAGADACPPFVIGVGLGGTFEKSCLLSKWALLRSLDSHHPDPLYADLETQALQRINALGIGPAGLGGDTTALAVLIETHPCHIASLPVAVNIECHAHRHKSIVL